MAGKWKGSSPLSFSFNILQFVNNIFYIKIKVNDKLLKNVYTRSSRPEVFHKKDVLKRFVKFTGKRLPAPESLFSET